MFTIVKVIPNKAEIEHGLTEPYTIVDSNGESREVYYGYATAKRALNRLTSKVESFEALNSYDEAYCDYNCPF